MTQVKAVIAKSLRDAAAEFNETTVPPVAVIWADPERLWEPVIEALQPAVPILRLGDYDPTIAQGPAIWMRAVLSAPESFEFPGNFASWETNPWVLYLPGISKGDFAEAERMPEELQPLKDIELRSAWWVQPTNRSLWTPHGFLKSKSGANLPLTNDDSTKVALSSVLGILLSESQEELQRRGRLDDERLHVLAQPDPIKSLLSWIGLPEATKAALSDPEWKALQSAANKTYGLNVDKDTNITAAKLLGTRQGAWAGVWERFAENPDGYPGVPEALDLARPSEGLLFADSASDPHLDSWPSWNKEQEDQLRAALYKIGDAPDRKTAAKQIGALTEAHQPRSLCVWAKLGQAPLAAALGSLETLSSITSIPITHNSVADWAGWYARQGFLADRYALEALGSVSSTDQQAVLAALNAVYDSWVDDTASEFQKAAVANYPGQVGIEVEPGTCVVFVDALRFDLAERLSELLDGNETALNHRIAAFPTITKTGQPAVAPIPLSVTSKWGGGAEFSVADASGHSLEGNVLDKALKAATVEVLDWDKPLGPNDADAIGWTKDNSIDSLGHAQGHALAGMLNQQLNVIADRIKVLLAAGWRRVIVVTDHGFILRAKALHKVELAKNVTEGGETRKRRVARLRQPLTVPVEFPTVPWTWDNNVAMVSAPGASSFEAGTLYEHGGLSLQECVIPVLTVTSDSSSPNGPSVAIAGVKWTRQRCRVDIEPSDAPVRVELRRAAGDADSGLADPKTNSNGEVRLLVDEEEAEAGTPAFIVLVADGKVVAQIETTVGGA